MRDYIPYYSPDPMKLKIYYRMSGIKVSLKERIRRSMVRRLM